MTTTPLVQLTGGTELLERAVGFALGAFPAVTPELLHAGTPCRLWRVQELMDHLNDGMNALRAAFDDKAICLEGSAEGRCSVAALQKSARGLLAAVSAHRARLPTVKVGGCPLSGTVVVAAGALELAVHGWDLAQGCGCPRPLPEALAADLLRLAPLLVSDEDRPGRFAMPVAAPAASSSSDRLLAWLGRAP